MIEFIVDLLVSAGVLVLMANIMPSVHVKSFGTAIWVAILVGL
ncbi:MAG: phage holin family protein [Hymenobacteraceae bacterium]|nr:phage holin family protein [Hymenobacteraceae bacterium]MDX5396195.1 phage holin family protein [Hymenobacteraceae bacterium]MDX5512257.1 phage holin family protein [Hymenobacteraceae bacterium]